jgi:hypothetical protein
MRAIDFNTLQQITPSSTFYAIIDLASEEEIYDYLIIYEPEYRCLYDGELKIQYEIVAPHIVALHPECEFTQWYLSQTSGKNQGIFFTSMQDIDRLKEHFSHYAKVEVDPNDLDETEVAGEFNAQTTHALFAFYDPRVFVEWMPSLTVEDGKIFFTPLEGIIIQDPKGFKKLLHYYIKEERLVCNKIALREDDNELV